MDFLQALKAHKGSLIRIKNQLYWYGGRGFDGAPGRICLLLDASAHTTAAAETGARTAITVRDAAALLLIDGRPQWIWVAQQDIEIL